MSVRTEPVSPAPEHTPPLDQDSGTADPGKRFSHAWTRWFISLREKVNVINEVVTSLSAIVGGGFVVVDGMEAVPREIEGTPGDIEVTNGDGVAGNPAIKSALTGVSAGSYVLATIEVNEQGKLVFAAAGDAPEDGRFFARRNGDWEEIILIPEAPEDGNIYGRQDGDWVQIP